MVAVAVTTKGDRIAVESPYHPDWPSRARDLGGRWNPSARVWTFDQRDEARVREAVTEIYGTDGTAPVDLVTVRIRVGGVRWGYLNESGNEVEPGSGGRWEKVEKFPGINPPEGETFFALGREICSRRGRDYRVKLGEGVVIIEGEFPASGGSRKNPCINAPTGMVLEVRDVPRTLALEAIEEEGTDAIWLVGESSGLSLDEQRLADALLALPEDRREAVLANVSSRVAKGLVTAMAYSEVDEPRR